MAVRKFVSVGPLRASGITGAESLEGDEVGLCGDCSRVVGCIGNCIEKRFGLPVVVLLLTEAMDIVLPWLWKLVRPEDSVECWLIDGLGGEATL